MTQATEENFPRDWSEKDLKDLVQAGDIARMELLSRGIATPIDPTSYQSGLTLASDKGLAVASGVVAALTAFNEVNNWLYRIGDVASSCAATGDFRPLKPYLETNTVSAKLIKGLVDLQDKLHQHLPMIENQPSIISFRSATKDIADKIDILAITIQDLAIKEAARDLYETLVNYRDTLARSAESIRSEIELGHRPEGTRDPVVNAVYKCGYVLFLKYHHKWARIRDEIWNTLTFRPQNKPLSPDENMIYTAWKNMSPRSRAQQVETAFAPRQDK